MQTSWAGATRPICVCVLICISSEWVLIRFLNLTKNSLCLISDILPLLSPSPPLLLLPLHRLQRILQSRRFRLSQLHLRRSSVEKPFFWVYRHPHPSPSKRSCKLSNSGGGSMLFNWFCIQESGNSNLLLFHSVQLQVLGRLVLTVRQLVSVNGSFNYSNPSRMNQSEQQWYNSSILHRKALLYVSLCFYSCDWNAHL